MSRVQKELNQAADAALLTLGDLRDRIPKAFKLYQDHAEQVQQYSKEITKAQRIVRLFRDEKELQTLGVVVGIQSLHSHGGILKDSLKFIGKDNEKSDWGKKMKVFSEERKRLYTLVQLSSVGLTKVDGRMTVDIKVMDAVDKAARKILGENRGLDLPGFLEDLDRKPDAKGKIRLTEKEYQKWENYQIKSQSQDADIKSLSLEVKTRIASNCLVEDQAIQILGPIVEDIWADVAFVKTEGLVAKGNAIQIGYAQTWDVFAEVLNRQEKRIATSRVTRIG